MKTAKIFLIIIAICFAACKKNESKKNIEKPNIDSLKNKTVLINPKFDTNILSDIKKFYQKEYGKKGEFQEQVNDSTYEITYRHIPDENNENDDYFFITIYISKIDSKKKLFATEPIIYGDINNDNFKDLIVTTHTEFGNGYGMWGNDIFVFINKNNKLMFTSVTTSRNLSGCGDNGNFLAEKIKNGYLIGHSFCYDPSDALCCPSLEYSTKVKLAGNKLVFNSKK